MVNLTDLLDKNDRIVYDETYPGMIAELTFHKPFVRWQRLPLWIAAYQLSLMLRLIRSANGARICRTDCMGKWRKKSERTKKEKTAEEGTRKKAGNTVCCFYRNGTCRRPA